MPTHFTRQWVRCTFLRTKSVDSIILSDKKFVFAVYIENLCYEILLVGSLIDAQLTQNIAILCCISFSPPLESIHWSMPEFFVPKKSHGSFALMITKYQQNAFTATVCRWLTVVANQHLFPLMVCRKTTVLLKWGCRESFLLLRLQQESCLYQWSSTMVSGWCATDAETLLYLALQQFKYSLHCRTRCVSVLTRWRATSLFILNASNLVLILFFHLVHECTRATAHYPQTMPNTCPSGVTSHSLLVAEATAWESWCSPFLCHTDRAGDELPTSWPKSFYMLGKWKTFSEPWEGSICWHHKQHPIETKTGPIRCYLGCYLGWVVNIFCLRWKEK